MVPFEVGFESVAVVVASSNGGLPPGTPVATMTYGGFAEYAMLDARHLIPVRNVPWSGLNVP